MTHYVFDTKNEADEAIAIVNQELGYPNETGGTISHDIPWERTDGKWVFTVPAREVSLNATIEEATDLWQSEEE